MEAIKRARTGHRASFTKVYNELNAVLLEVGSDKEDIIVLFELLQEKMAELDESSAKVLNFILSSETTPTNTALYDTESDSTDEYKKRYLKLKRKVSNLVSGQQNHVPANSTNCVTPQPEVKKTFKLPKIEIVKFSGNVRDWLLFWNQFRKIHEDPQVDDEDKFQHLIQSVELGSRAFELVNSFPPTRENYQKAITSLKNRYGRDELQVEVYVRELLNLVLNNVSRGKEKTSLASLYDKLETHMRALETLGVTSDKCAAMLFPLVESSLPEDILRAWQRTSAAGGAKDSQQRLTKLMDFLCAEVESEERINMAVAGFTLNGNSEKPKQNKNKEESTRKPPTAMGLLTMKSESAVECIFCKNCNHESQDCFKAKKMSIYERREIVKESNCCLNCLKHGHAFRRCKVKIKCAWCNKPHVLLMCPETSKSTNVPKIDNAETKVALPAEKNLASFIDPPEVYLQTLRVKMISEQEERVVRALIDSGSQRSYITRGIADEMGYKPKDTRELAHSLFGGTKSQAQIHNVYSVRLRSLNDDYACNFEVMDQAVICDEICCVKPAAWNKELCASKIYLSDIGDKREAIGLLIGADVAGKLLTGRKHNLQNGLTAIETYLGWTVMGKDTNERTRKDTVLLVNSSTVEQANVSDLWCLDILGIGDPVRRESKKERDAAVKQSFKETAVFNDEARYEVVLPWIQDHSPLSSNKVLATKRLETTLRSLRKNELMEDYDKVFCEWERDGIIEKVPAADLDNFAHYLPHRPVVKPNSSTTKIRPVFDASAKERNFPSLNQCLEKGPNLMELIPSILLRFREKLIGATADVKGAFLQISLAPRERDYLRFIWHQNGETVHFRHRRVVFGVTCSPFLLGATIDLHLERICRGEVDTVASKETIEKLKDCFYSDNCVTSIDSAEELHIFMKEATDALKTANFELRRWEYTRDNTNNETTVLGVLWDKENDALSVNLSSLEDLQIGNLTKRIMLSIAQRIFDPIGFICPVTLCPKLLLQQSWKKNIDWDETVEQEVKIEFRKWLMDLSALKKVKIPRKLGTTDRDAQVSFHAFADASGVAYATVVFIRIEHEDQVEVQLIGAKTRVAPQKEITIPRLELLAATITARLTDSLTKVLKLKISEIVYWSDSTTVLAWINGEAQWNTFVWNRVQEIRALTAGSIWRHVPGTQNPADLPSRGCSSTQLAASKWWEGPAWLKLPKHHWPHAECEADEEEVNSEVKSSALKSTALLNKAMVVDSNIVFRYFAKYDKIVKTVACLIRFTKNARVTKAEIDKRCLLAYVTSDEIKDAELLLLKLVQKEMFSGVEDNKLKSLDVFIDENELLRVRTKIFYRDDKRDFRCPVVLDSSHIIVQRIIEKEHLDLGHAGLQILLCSLRERYWILTARRKIRSVLSRCGRCKRYEAKRMEAMSIPLPIDRVRDAAVFEVIGIDLAGPLYLRGNEKAYICLFTCAVYRAIHLELLSSLSTSAFLKGFSRFIARRGRPHTVFTDNGRNFVGAENDLKALNWEKIAECSAVKRIDWHFNPPSAAWWGGWWERLIRIVKQLLRRILGKASVNFEDMSTILCDCEAIVNARPLTYVSNDCSDLTPLTPSMFIQEVREIGVPDLDNLLAVDVKEHGNYLQKLRDDLRQRFRSEYLGQLRETVKVKKSRNLSVGELVLIGSDDKKRIEWPIGRIVTIFRGKDDRIRVCRVKTQSGELTRPVQRLYPLELDCPVSSELDKASKPLLNKRITNVRSQRLVKRPKGQAPDSLEIKENCQKIDNINGQYVTRAGRKVKSKIDSFYL